MTEPLPLQMTAYQLKILMGVVFFIGITLVSAAIAVLGAAILGLLPVSSAGYGLAPLISGIASVSAAVFLSH
ncbi:hypothetical protein [Saccharospirillum impatiens]|uniref:hypothetical protein n=1 Tax=Saccharospirillum impatiens TaxID=169438 RepID=UPI000423B928|nr:hypothetical protein [Saccharospirillum impatiens]